MFRKLVVVGMICFGSVGMACDVPVEMQIEGIAESIENANIEYNIEQNINKLIYSNEQDYKALKHALTEHKEEFTKEEYSQGSWVLADLRRVIERDKLIREME